jgi:hypothetical protein
MAPVYGKWRHGDFGLVMCRLIVARSWCDTGQAAKTGFLYCLRTHAGASNGRLNNPGSEWFEEDMAISA